MTGVQTCALPILSVVTYSCSDDDNNAVADDFKVQFTVPQSADLFRGGDLYFSVVDGEAPLVSDVIMLESSGGVFYNCTISGVSESSFAVSVPADIVVILTALFHYQS